MKKIILINDFYQIKIANNFKFDNTSLLTTIIVDFDDEI